jgi:hypothetical protein
MDTIVNEFHPPLVITTDFPKIRINIIFAFRPSLWPCSETVSASKILYDVLASYTS